MSTSGLVQRGGALGDPLLHRALDEIELVGEQVDARDHRVDGIPGR